MKTLLMVLCLLLMAGCAAVAKPKPARSQASATLIIFSAKPSDALGKCESSVAAEHKDKLAWEHYAKRIEVLLGIAPNQLDPPNEP